MKKKIIITFCGCKPSQKTTLSYIKILQVLRVEVLDERQDTKNIERYEGK